MYKQCEDLIREIGMHGQCRLFVHKYGTYRQCQNLAHKYDPLGQSKDLAERQVSCAMCEQLTYKACRIMQEQHCESKCN